jgi:cell division protein FtsQ
VTAVNIKEPDEFGGFDDSQFVMLSPVNVKPRFKVKPDVKGREKNVLETGDGETEVSEEGDASGKMDAVAPLSRMQKVFKMVFFVCVIFFTGELVWLFLIAPMRPLSSVVIAGTEPGLLEKSDVLKAAGIGAKTSYFSFNTKAVERNLGTVPVIEGAKAVKQFPRSVRITVVPRKRVALFLRNLNGKIVPVYFDKHGVVFKVGGERDIFLSVPVVSGIENTTVAEGERLPSAYIPLFENLDKLSSVSPKLYEAISEIEINRKTYDGFDVTLFPSQSPVKIRMNAELDEETIGSAFLLLDVFEAKGMWVSEIDFRAGTASYMVKEVDDQKNQGRGITSG